MIYDFVIIGAGAIGLNTAIALNKKHPKAKIIILERFDGIGRFASGHNAGLIHSGIHEDRRYKLKAPMCIRGNALLREFCRKHQVPLKQTGMLISVSVQLESDQLRQAHARLEDLAYNAEELEIKYHYMDSRQAQAMSGNRNIVEALYVPNVYLIDIYNYLDALLNVARDTGITIMHNANIANVKVESNTWNIRLSTQEKIQGNCVINCAGGHADLVTKQFHYEIPVQHLYQGDFYAIKDKCVVEQVRLPINPVMPKGAGKGVHVYRTLKGYTWLGPVTQMVKDRDYTSLMSAKPKPVSQQELNNYARLFFGNHKLQFVHHVTGFRCKIVPEGKDDDFHFVVLRGAKPRFASFYGIQSPGLTASISLGEYAARQIQ